MSTSYNKTVSASISAQNTFTGWVRVSAKQGKPNNFSAFMENDASLVATWVVQAQRRIEDSSGNVTYGTTIDLNSDTTAGIYTAQLVGDWEIRVGVKTGGYTSGTGTVGIAWA